MVVIPTNSNISFTQSEQFDIYICHSASSIFENTSAI